MLASKVHIERAKKRLTQQGLADAIGVHRQTISRWERGFFDVAEMASVYKASKFLGCSIYDLFEEGDPS
jgi:putative transcriptional regulator